MCDKVATSQGTRSTKCTSMGLLLAKGPSKFLPPGPEDRCLIVFTAREDGILVQGATGESEVVQAQVQAKIAARTG